MTNEGALSICTGDTSKLSGVKVAGRLKVKRTFSLIVGATMLTTFTTFTTFAGAFFFTVVFASLTVVKAKELKRIMHTLVLISLIIVFIVSLLDRPNILKVVW